MKLQIEMGNPNTLEWELCKTIALTPCIGESSTVAFKLPTKPHFIVESSIEKYNLDIHGEESVEIYIFYSSSENMVSIIVNFRGQQLTQAMGGAFAENGSGLTLQFRAPGTTVPVNLVCAK